ncbi:ribosomal RNA-processing protein 7 [Kwoniella mangroviensis CBS 8886]|nr:ribosomal RNA-processing protein 7 [Kwoniella mangroviensis CBS 8886]
MKPSAKSSKLTSTITSKSKKSNNQSKSKLYSNFLPIPLLLPSPSSSKSTTHYVYVRPHSAKSSTSDGKVDLPEDRTLFVTNLPVDAGLQDLRGVFGKWGVVEDIKMGGSHGGDNILEKAVRGLEVDPESESESESDSEDEDEHNDEDGDEHDEEEGEKTEPQFQFQGDIPIKLTKNQRRRQRRNARNALPPSVPEIINLPDLNPRQSPLGISGSHSCHIIYLDPISITRLMSSTTSPINLTKYTSEPAGLEYYTSLYNTCRPDLSAVKEYADSSMDRFDHLHGLLLSSRAKAQGAGALVDEDGFTVVVRSGRYGRAGARGDEFGTGKGGVGVASTNFQKKMKKKKEGSGAGELKDFYKFQRNERKRQELAELRSKFESDKQKVEELKKNRRFKPY